MKGETTAHAGFHSANAAMTQNEDQMAEATIGALANLATATAADRGVVAALTQANSHLVKQLEETASELRELKALFHQERRGKRTQEVSPHLQVITVGHMATKWARLTQASLATLATLATKLKPLGLRTWEAVKPTRNDVSGRQL
jgi:phage shock protein A